MTHLLIVSPLHNEESNIEGLAATLACQTHQDFTWVLVDDGSTDSTPARLAMLEGRGHIVVRKPNDGGLVGGSAYTSWRYGIAAATARHPDIAFSHIMKLDADVRLPPHYLEEVVATCVDDVGICGGIIASPGMREQVVHVPGPVKLYSLAAYTVAAELPAAIGFDVMDEIAVAQAGLRTVVRRDLPFTLSRAIGASEGRIHGRYRNGRVCRWTGYDPIYFGAHALRYLGRRPYVVGTIAMIWGYLTAGIGPYPAELRTAHRRMQQDKLNYAARSPLRFLQETY